MNANLGKEGKSVTSTSTDKGMVEWISKNDYIDAGGTESDWNNHIRNDKEAITAQLYLLSSTTSWTKLN